MRKLLVTASIALLTLTGCGCCNFCPFDEDEDSCCYPGYPEYPVPQAPPNELPDPVLSIHKDEIISIVQQVSVDFKHDQHLNLQHANAYFNEDGIHTIQLQYISQDILDLCKARKFIVDLTEALLVKLNQNPYLIPEFPNFAFFPYNFEIYIVFESFFIRYVDPFYIKWICMEDGQIAYFTADLDDNNKDCWHVRRESYYTSRDIVIYERKAETEYRKAHQSNLSVFGDKRYVPPGEEEEYPPKPDPLPRSWR